MSLINTTIESLTRAVISYIRENIGYIFSTISDNGVRNKRKVSVSSDFPDSWILDDDGNIVETLANGTRINRELRLPTIAVSMYSGSNVNVGTGSIVGLDQHGRRIRGYRNDFVIQADVWANTPRERDEISSKVKDILFKKRQTVIRQLGIEEIRLLELGERGFDLTDRILQYQSHQITKVWRRLLEFRIVSESYFVDQEESENIVIERLDLNTNFGTTTNGMVIGDLVEEYLKDVWENVNVGLYI